MHATLRSYAQLNARPSVSFAEHSADSPLTVQAFLSQTEFTEDGNLRVTSMSEADHAQLGRAADQFIVLDQIVILGGGGLMGNYEV